MDIINMIADAIRTVSGWEVTSGLFTLVMLLGLTVAMFRFTETPAEAEARIARRTRRRMRRDGRAQLRAARRFSRENSHR